MQQTEFKTLAELFEYLHENRSHLAYSEMTNSQYPKFKEIIFNVFASKWTEDPETMLDVFEWFHHNVHMDFGLKVRTWFDMFHTVPLSLYKFCIVCQVRGPHTEEEFERFVIENALNSDIINIARHPSFPATLREYFFKQTQDPAYLPQTAQDIFVF